MKLAARNNVEKPFMFVYFVDAPIGLLLDV